MFLWQFIAQRLLGGAAGALAKSPHPGFQTVRGQTEELRNLRLAQIEFQAHGEQDVARVDVRKTRAQLIAEVRVDAVEALHKRSLHGREPLAAAHGPE